MKSLRILIESGAWPAGDEEARRLARRATSVISNPKRQADLCRRLVLDLSMIEMQHICGMDNTGACQVALNTLDEIEAASRPA